MTDESRGPLRWISLVCLAALLVGGGALGTYVVMRRAKPAAPPINTTTAHGSDAPAGAPPASEAAPTRLGRSSAARRRRHHPVRRRGHTRRHRAGASGDIQYGECRPCARDGAAERVSVRHRETDCGWPHDPRAGRARATGAAWTDHSRRSIVLN